MEKREQNQRVVITGMGTVNPLGNDVPTTWKRLLAGESGIDHFTRFDVGSFHTQIGGEVKDFDPAQYMEYKEARRTDPFIQYAMAATSQALQQSGLEISNEIADEVGVIVGTGIGGLTTVDNGYQTIREKGPRWVNPFTASMMLPNMAAGMIAIQHKVRGPNHCVVSACATGNTAIGEGWEIIRRGDARAMIVGASEAGLLPFTIAAFDRIQALSRRNDEPKKASRPFDAQRDGFVAGEGAATLILEDLEFAKARGAKILGEVTGYGSSADAYHVTAPAEGGSGAALAMERALKKAGITPEEVDYINAHGTSTPLNDKSETEAIKKVFGEYAYKVPVSSTKSMTGHLLGASGVVEAIVCLLTIQDQMIHPTINYEYPDPDCDLDYVPNTARPAKVKTALSNAFGFGGHNACIVVRAFED
ncbi:MAG: beta-ketoacyl-ACP synthase II [Chloroflexi bacterium]|nr:beta-ketoacyl-ACP synthase II [Chloroflexota bacterium]